MEVIRQIIGFVGIVIVIPIWGLTGVLIIMGIVGLVKKDFAYFKRVLRVWCYCWLAFLALLLVYFIITFMSSL